MVLPQNSKGFHAFKWQIKKGNNSIVIKNCFKARWWWSKAKKGTEILDIDLLWDPGRNKDFIRLLLIYPKKKTKAKTSNENDLSTSFISSTDEIERD